MEQLLELAVPQWIERLKNKQFKDFESRRDAILETVCYKGDLLLYGSKKKGETAQLFNDLAEGLAWLALIAKGGVTFGDQHWDAEFTPMPDMPEGAANESTCESQAVQDVRGGPSEAPSGTADADAGSNG